MPITNSDQLIAGLVAGAKRMLVKASQTTEGAGTFHSLWKALGEPAAGANPPAFNAGSGYQPTKGTTGAIPFTNPTSPALSYLGLLSVALGQIGQLIIYDRLWACSGFATNSTSLQSVTTPGQPNGVRNPFTGYDVEPWIEVYTAPGATGATWTVTGTDANGNTGKTWTYAHPANAESVGQMTQLLPGGAAPATSLGIRQVDSFQASVSSGTAGDVGVTLVRRLADLPLPFANVVQDRDFVQLGGEALPDDACLAMMVLCSTTSTGLLQGRLKIAQN